MRCQPVPSVCHQLSQQSSQAPQVLILELVNGLAQRAAMKGTRSEPVELYWGNLAAMADSRATVTGPGTRTGLGKATVLADWGLDRFDFIQAVSAQPSAQALAGCTVGWKEQIESDSLEFVDPRQSRRCSFGQTRLVCHSLQALRTSADTIVWGSTQWTTSPRR
jgi:hypothetical protein